MKKIFLMSLMALNLGLALPSMANTETTSTVITEIKTKTVDGMTVTITIVNTYKNGVLVSTVTTTNTNLQSVSQSNEDYAARP